MTPDIARDELVNQAKDLQRHLQHLDILERELTAHQLRQRIEAEEKLIAAQRHPFNTIPAVVLCVAAAVHVADRRKFLVLGGTSRLDKKNKHSLRWGWSLEARLWK